MKFLKNRNFWLFIVIGLCLMFVCSAFVAGLTLYEKGDSWVVWNISDEREITAIYINGVNQTNFDSHTLMYGIQDLEAGAPYTIKIIFNDSSELSDTQKTNEKIKSGFDKVFDSLDYYFVLILFCIILFVAMLTKRFIAFIVSVLSVGMFGISLTVKNDFYLSFAFIILFIVSLLVGYEGISED